MGRFISRFKCDVSASLLPCVGPSDISLRLSAGSSLLSFDLSWPRAGPVARCLRLGKFALLSEWAARHSRRQEQHKNSFHNALETPTSFNRNFHFSQLRSYPLTFRYIRVKRSGFAASVFGLFGVGEELQIRIATPTGRNLCLRDGEDYRANSLRRRTPPAASGRQFASHW
jgi:hypothetical protein